MTATVWVFLPEYGEAHEYGGSLTCNIHRLSAEPAGFTVDSWTVDGRDISVHSWGRDATGPTSLDELIGWCRGYAEYRAEAGGDDACLQC